MKQILLLEDLPEIRVWLKTLALQVFPGAQISEASRIHDALELVNAVRFDVAMVDLGLPDGSGVEVVQALREKQPDVQSVVVTIHDDDDHLFPALQAGAFGYLLKEQSREQLAEQLHRISQGEPPLSPSIARRVIQYFTAQARQQPIQPDTVTPHVQLTDRENEVQYLRHILSHDLSFGIGPAGTGKTFLAVACAVDALERSAVQRIVLTRPAVEAGERLGFLPGDLTQKVDPYLRPLYDALYDLMGFDRVTKAFEKGLIEIAPLAFMRGRTLNHAFVILDEAQNTTPEQMKMFLTRIGFGARAVVTGDVSQIDLPRGAKSGLIDAERVLKRVKGVAFTRFTAADVVRHPLVARIVEAYDAAQSAEPDPSNISRHGRPGAKPPTEPSADDHA